jgi:hypothetical protein
MKMKIKVDNVEILELNETQKKVIKNDILEDAFEADMKMRLKYILINKYERCLERLKSEWIPRLKDRIQSIPTNDEALAELIFSQPDYKNRSQRDAKNI